MIMYCRFSIWLDSKLRLQNDPVLILEYFLWRGGHEYAISNHYDRHCVWEEVQQNKKLNKYNHTAIDEQFAFYKADGLTRFNASDPEKLLSSSMFFKSKTHKIYSFVHTKVLLSSGSPTACIFSMFFLLRLLQMFPKVHLSFESILLCQIFSLVYGSMK